jgi:competence ComEA-like helix-hairpin-helix protein
MLISVVSVVAQVPDSVEQTVQRDLEMLMEDIDEESGIDTEQLTQFLQDLAANPLNLNTAGVEELMQVPGITLRIATRIVAFRAKSGRFDSIADLEKVKGIGPSLRNRIQPYVKVEARSARIKRFDVNKLTSRGQTEVIARFRSILEPLDGYGLPDTVRTRYVGGQAQHYQRVTYASEFLSVNLTQETDPGERSTQPVSPDFRSMHVALQNLGKLKTLVIGDFTAGFGQGLAMFSGGAARKGREVIGAANRGERSIRPYRSAEESRFFRGIGFEFGEKLAVAGFYSNRNWSASPAGDTAFFYPSLTGLNRTPAELERRNNLGIETVAGRLKFNGDKIRTGLTAYQATFSAPIAARSGIQNRYAFRGQSHYAGAVDLRYLTEEVQFFGEAAYSKEQASAWYAGSEWYAGDATTLTLIYRDYSEQYISLFGDAFSEGSGMPQNEQGLYMGLRHNIDKQFTVAAYADQYRFPGPRASVSRSSSGTDLLGTLEFSQRGRWSAYALVRTETQDVETTGTDNAGRSITVFGKQTRSSLRLNGDFPVNPALRWRTRIELARFDFPQKPASTGLLMYHDFRFVPFRSWQFDTRISFFDTRSFDARVYQFENDLLFVMSNTALSGRGRRFYLLAKWTPNRKTEVWAKYDITAYDDRSEVGSGLDRSDGNLRSRFGIQARWRF